MENPSVNSTSSPITEPSDALADSLEELAIVQADDAKMIDERLLRVFKGVTIKSQIVMEPQNAPDPQITLDSFRHLSPKDQYTVLLSGRHIHSGKLLYVLKSVMNVESEEIIDQNGHYHAAALRKLLAVQPDDLLVYPRVDNLPLFTKEEKMVCTAFIEMVRLSTLKLSAKLLQSLDMEELFSQSIQEEDQIDRLAQLKDHIQKAIIQIEQTKSDEEFNQLKQKIIDLTVFDEICRVLGKELTVFNDANITVESESDGQRSTCSNLLPLLENKALLVKINCARKIASIKAMYDGALDMQVENKSI